MTPAEQGRLLRHKHMVWSICCPPPWRRRLEDFRCYRRRPVAACHPRQALCFTFLLMAAFTVRLSCVQRWGKIRNSAPPLNEGSEGSWLEYNQAFNVMLMEFSLLFDNTLNYTSKGLLTKSKILGRANSKLCTSLVLHTGDSGDSNSLQLDSASGYCYVWKTSLNTQYAKLSFTVCLTSNKTDIFTC